MKKILFLFCLSTVLISCTTDDDNVNTDIENFNSKLPSEYLFTGYESDGKTSPIELPFEESYDFNEDGTLTKTRTSESNTTTVNGTFTIITEDGFQNIRITLENDDITTNCDNTQLENLVILSNTTFVNRTDACDGPNYRYSKIQ